MNYRIILIQIPIILNLISFIFEKNYRNIEISSFYLFVN